MKWLKQLQSLHTKLVIVYVLLIIIGMQIIGLYFTNSLEKEYSITLKEHNTIREAVRCKHRESLQR